MKGRLPHLGALLVAGLTALVAIGCGLPLSSLAPRTAELEPFNGAVLEPPLELAPFTLQRTDGRAFSSAETRGRLSLFFFGYTTCPDVCPLTLAHVAQLRRELGEANRGVDAYFVTVDPERDTPQRLAEYVRAFDADVTPLTGSDEQLERVRDLFGVVAQKRPAPESAAGYFVDHSAGLYLVGADSRVQLLYPYGMGPAEIGADLRRLAEALPATTLAIEQAWARPAASGTSAIYLTVRNDGPTDDTLTAAQTAVAESTELHRGSMEGGVMKMMPAGPLVVPAHGRLELRPGGLHVMLIGLRQELAEGEQVTLTLHFERAGQITTAVPVRRASGG